VAQQRILGVSRPAHGSTQEMRVWRVDSRAGWLGATRACEIEIASVPLP
jgi:hypothetical protein